jgi:hypothetical protein
MQSWLSYCRSLCNRCVFRPEDVNSLRSGTAPQTESHGRVQRNSDSRSYITPHTGSAVANRASSSVSGLTDLNSLLRYGSSREKDRRTDSSKPKREHMGMTALGASAVLPGGSGLDNSFGWGKAAQRTSWTPHRSVQLNAIPSNGMSTPTNDPRTKSRERTIRRAPSPLRCEDTGTAQWEWQLHDGAGSALSSHEPTIVASDATDRPATSERKPTSKPLGRQELGLPPKHAPLNESRAPRPASGNVLLLGPTGYDVVADSNVAKDAVGPERSPVDKPRRIRSAHSRAGWRATVRISCCEPLLFLSSTRLLCAFGYAAEPARIGLRAFAERTAEPFALSLQEKNSRAARLSNGLHCARCSRGHSAAT